MSLITTRLSVPAGLALVLLLAACSSGNGSPGQALGSDNQEPQASGSGEQQPSQAPEETAFDDATDAEEQPMLLEDSTAPGDFELRSINSGDLVLVEGDPEGLTIPILLNRQNGHNAPVELNLGGQSIEDSASVTGSFTFLTLNPDADSSEVTLRLAIADLPILPQTRNFIITATDGVSSDRTVVQVQVEPVDAPDVYLLAGQSNMVGFSGDGTRDSSLGGLDAVDSRILQLNASENDSQSIFRRPADFTSTRSNVVAPNIVVAQDPLHVPLEGEENFKEFDYIGLGLSFAKAALPNTSRNIVLVPAAWSGSAFCANRGGPDGQWNPSRTNNRELGNTLLFDRAVARTNITLAETGGILRGILWHQGESDANERCSGVYADNLNSLVRAFRTEINPDLRGPDLRRPEANIPFVVGTMSIGIDARGDLSDFTDSKQAIDDAHRDLPNMLSHTALSNHDDLVPANGFPCGNTSCVHFGAEALREMGFRYHEALRQASQ